MTLAILALHAVQPRRGPRHAPVRGRAARLFIAEPVERARRAVAVRAARQAAVAAAQVPRQTEPRRVPGREYDVRLSVRVRVRFRIRTRYRFIRVRLRERRDCIRAQESQSACHRVQNRFVWGCVLVTF